MPDSPTYTSSSPRQEEQYNFPPIRNSLFGWIEFFIVFFIGLGIILIMICSIASAFGFWGNQYQNIITVVANLEGHWKAGLLIFIPLFFRPIFKFLMNLKEGPWGSRTELPSQKRHEQGGYSPRRK